MKLPSACALAFYPLPLHFVCCSQLPSVCKDFRAKQLLPLCLLVLTPMSTSQLYCSTFTPSVEENLSGALGNFSWPLPGGFYIITLAAGNPV